MSYVSEVYQALEKKHSNEAEFLEAAKRILESLEPIVAANEELYRKNALLERFVEPERIIVLECLGQMTRESTISISVIVCSLTLLSDLTREDSVFTQA